MTAALPRSFRSFTFTLPSLFIHLLFIAAIGAAFALMCMLDFLYRFDGGIDGSRLRRPAVPRSLADEAFRLILEILDVARRMASDDVAAARKEFGGRSVMSIVSDGHDQRRSIMLRSSRTLPRQARPAMLLRGEVNSSRDGVLRGKSVANAGKQ